MTKAETLRQRLAAIEEEYQRDIARAESKRADARNALLEEAIAALDETPETPEEAPKKTRQRTPATTKVACHVCRKGTTLTQAGVYRQHNDPTTNKICKATGIIPARRDDSDNAPPQSTPPASSDNPWPAEQAGSIF